MPYSTPPRVRFDDRRPEAEVELAAASSRRRARRRSGPPRGSARAGRARRSRRLRPRDLRQLARASRSASRSSSRSRAGAPSTRPSTSSTSAAMSRKPMRPSRNAATATSFAALKAHGNVPPRSPASRASASSRNVSRSGSKNSSGPAVEVERRNRRRGALRVRERVRDRHAHVRVAEMRERGTVAEADEPVDDRRRMDDDFDPVVRQSEEEVRLDHLEALVRERRRVDRDLRAHAPGRVSERILGVTSASSARVRPRNGPPLAVSTIASGSPASAHW